MAPRSVPQFAAGVRGRRSRFVLQLEAIDGLDALGRIACRSGQIVPFSRGGTVGSATQSDSLGVLRVVGSQEPRLHTVGGYSGWLIEATWQNLVTRSEELDNGVWAKAAAGSGTAPVVTPDQGLAPNGKLTADKVVFVAPGAGDISQLSSEGFATTAQSYAGGIWVKAFAAADVGKILLLRHVGASPYASVTLTAEWQRVERVEVSASGTRYLEIVLRPSLGSSSGTVSAYLWGGHLGPGLVAGSYIPTAGVAVTRSADAPLSIPLGLTPSQIDAAGGLTVYADYVDLGSQLNQAGVILIGSTGFTDPWAALPYYGSTTVCTFSITNNAGARVNSGNITTGIVTGDRVETRGVIRSAGGLWTVEGGLSRNAGAELAAAISTTLAAPTTFSSQNLHFGFLNSGGALMLLRSLRAALGPQTQAYMRAA